MYHDVVLWMLKRDMLITLHLRIRVVVTRELKVRVRLAREKALSKTAGGRRAQNRSGLRQELEATSSGIAWLSLSPKSARRYSRRIPSSDSVSSKMSELIIREEDGEEEEAEEEDEDEEREERSESDTGEENAGWDSAEDHLWPSVINDPGRATPLQRRWLSAMSEHKETQVARRFEL